MNQNIIRTGAGALFAIVILVGVWFARTEQNKGTITSTAPAVESQNIPPVTALPSPQAAAAPLKGAANTPPAPVQLTSYCFSNPDITFDIRPQTLVKGGQVVFTYQPHRAIQRGLTIKISDQGSGNTVKSLYSTTQSVPANILGSGMWDGTDNKGNRVAAGNYLVSITESGAAMAFGACQVVVQK